MNILKKWFAGITSTTPRITIGKDGWQANTRENPFWKGSETFMGNAFPVEVLYYNGTTKIIQCPKCYARSFDLVKAWRKVGSEA